MSTQTATPAKISDNIQESKQGDSSVAIIAKNNLAMEANSPDNTNKNFNTDNLHANAQANRFLPKISIDKNSDLYGSIGKNVNGSADNSGLQPNKQEEKPFDKQIKDFSPEKLADQKSWTQPENKKETEKQLEDTKKSISQGDDDAERETDQIADSIKRDGTLGPGGEGKANEDALRNAMNSGELDAYVARINEKLEKAGSPYRVSAEQYRQRMNYKQDVGNKAINPQNHQQDNPRAKIHVTNTKTGKTFLQAHLASDPSRPGYYSPNPAKDYE